MSKRAGQPVIVTLPGWAASDAGVWAETGFGAFILLLAAAAGIWSLSHRGRPAGRQ